MYYCTLEPTLPILKLVFGQFLSFLNFTSIINNIYLYMHEVLNAPEKHLRCSILRFYASEKRSSLFWKEHTPRTSATASALIRASANISRSISYKRDERPLFRNYPLGIFSCAIFTDTSRLLTLYFWFALLLVLKLGSRIVGCDFSHLHHKSHPIIDSEEEKDRGAGLVPDPLEPRVASEERKCINIKHNQVRH